MCLWTASDHFHGADVDLRRTTTSLAEQAMDYRYEHGRRYHAYSDGSKSSSKVSLVFLGD